MSPLPALGQSAAAGPVDINLPAVGDNGVVALKNDDLAKRVGRAGGRVDSVGLVGRGLIGLAEERPEALHLTRVRREHAPGRYVAGPCPASGDEVERVGIQDGRQRVARQHGIDQPLCIRQLSKARADRDGVGLGERVGEIVARQRQSDCLRRERQRKQQRRARRGELNVPRPAPIRGQTAERRRADHRRPAADDQDASERAFVPVGGPGGKRAELDDALHDRMVRRAQAFASALNVTASIDSSLVRPARSKTSARPPIIAALSVQ